MRFPVILSLVIPLAATAGEPPVSVDSLVAEIVAHHPELEFYEAEIAAARAEGRTSASGAAPELSVEIGRKRTKEPSGALAGEGTAWGVSVDQTFEWPGRIALRKAVAQREVELAQAGLAQFRAALETQARVLAGGLRAAQAKADATEEVAARFTALKETFLAREPAGLTPLLETRVLEAQELATQRRATEAGLAVQAALVEINQLRGRRPDTPLLLEAPGVQFGHAPELSALLEAARENNFDYRARRLELEQQGLLVRLARHERYPAVTVSPFFEREAAGERETTVGVGLSLPLPLIRDRRAPVDAAEARRAQAEVAVRAAWRQLEREVIAAAQAFAAKVAEVQRWSPDSVARFREAAATADRHYRLGAVPLSTYVELQHAYLEAVEALLDTEREAVEAGLQLELLTGLNFGAVRQQQP